MIKATVCQCNGSYVTPGPSWSSEQTVWILSLYLIYLLVVIIKTKKQPFRGQVNPIPLILRLMVFSDCYWWSLPEGDHREKIIRSDIEWIRDWAFGDRMIVFIVLLIVPPNLSSPTYQTAVRGELVTEHNPRVVYSCLPKSIVHRHWLIWFNCYIFYRNREHPHKTHTHCYCILSKPKALHSDCIGGWVVFSKRRTTRYCHSTYSW